MQRVALVAPTVALRDVLVRVADSGDVEVDRDEGDPRSSGRAAGLLRQLAGPPSAPVLSPAVPDLDALAAAGRADLLAGEAELEQVAASAVRQGEVDALLGWCPAPAVPALTERLAALGASVVPLPAPHGIDPPTLLPDGGALRHSFAPLISTYGTVPYPDVDPTLLAGIAYVLMFGMMFGDAGQGALLLLVALLLRLGRPRRFARLHGAWPFVAGAALASVVFGVLYGEFFGPTGVLPVLWLSPLEEPARLLEAAVGVGGLLLGASYVVAIVNRWREGGPQLALYASAGIAGAVTFLGIGSLATGLYLSSDVLVVAGIAVVLLGLVLSGVGFFAAAGGGAAGAVQAVVEVFDAALRTGSNLVSFSRLAAFGLTHAALGWLVWSGTTGLAQQGGIGVLAAVAVFVLGNALTFALEGLVAAIQALRLEFYELFSRVFSGEGRPFRPWHVPTALPATGPAPPAPSSLHPSAPLEVPS
jgi:V/A-type H+-transporting ATPase subunit I